MDDKNPNVSGVPLKYTTNATSPKKPQRRVTKMSRRRYRKDYGAVVALVLLFAVVITFSVILIIRNEKKAPDAPETGTEIVTESSAESESETESESDAPETKDESIRREAAEYVDLTEADVHDGDLILVNHNYAYVFPTEDVLLQMKPRAEHFLVSTLDTSLRSAALDAFVSLTNDLYDATGVGEVLVVSSFRGEEKQREIYQDRVDRYGPEYAAAYVANPGYSEHHTGLAMDLTVYTDGASYDIETYERTEWFMQNYDRYGYVLRYPEDKADITLINYEGWHYRYVGLPHSLIMDSLDLCLEEYIEDFLPNHTIDSAVCYNGATGEIKYVDALSYEKSADESLVYYVKSEGGKTSVPIAATPYEISGDNVAGFVVTIK